MAAFSGERTATGSWLLCEGSFNEAPAHAARRAHHQIHRVCLMCRHVSLRFPPPACLMHRISCMLFHSIFGSYLAIQFSLKLFAVSAFMTCPSRGSLLDATPCAALISTAVHQERARILICMLILSGHGSVPVIFAFL